MKTSIRDAAGVLHLPLVLIRKSNLIYFAPVLLYRISRETKITYRFLLFLSAVFVKTISYILHTPEAAIKNFPAKKVFLKFPMVNKKLLNLKFQQNP